MRNKFVFVAPIVTAIALLLGCAGSTQSDSAHSNQSATMAAAVQPAIARTTRRVHRAIHHPPAAPTATARAPASNELVLFDTEETAQAHCPTDQVVWLNPRSGIYHLKGMRWYGNTRQGAYVCRRAADVAGDRETLNGQ